MFLHLHMQDYKTRASAWPLKKKADPNVKNTFKLLLLSIFKAYPFSIFLYVIFYSLNFTMCFLYAQYFIEQDLALVKDNYIFFLKTG